MSSDRFSASLRKHMEASERKRLELIDRHGPSFEHRSHGFSVNIAEAAVIDDWIAELQAEVIAKQQASGHGDPLGQPVPYYGAIGGGLEYTFTPTGLGTILTVKESTTGKTLNVTDALDWYFFD